MWKFRVICQTSRGGEYCGCEGGERPMKIEKLEELHQNINGCDHLILKTVPL